MPPTSHKSPPSPRMLEALRFIGNVQGGASARGLAEFLWPGHYCHTASSNGGHGAQGGKKAWLMAGSYAGRMAKRGFIDCDFSCGTTYKLTKAGRDAIAAAADQKETKPCPK